MRLKAILFSIIFCFSIIILNADNNFVNPDDYRVNVNDVFVMQMTVPDTVTVFVPVSLTGHLNLYPVTDTVFVAGLTLSEAYQKINQKIKSAVKKIPISVILYKNAPIRFHMSGAVNIPGEFISEELLTLSLAIRKAGGITNAASNRVIIKRSGKEIECNLSKYLSEADNSQNPIIYSGDIIEVPFAKEALKVYANNDTVNVVEAIELSQETSVEEVIRQLKYKNALSDMNQFTLIREGKTTMVSKEEKVKNNDKLIIAQEDVFVYVIGSVENPGRYPYNGNRNPIQYIGMAGGPLISGSSSSYIIKKDGTKKKYKGQAIHPGDTIYVPESYRAIVAAYLVPVSTVISVISTIILLSRN